jgi:hypothetical protein
MSIHPDTLANLQRAGQQVFDASEAFKSDLQAIAAALVQQVAAEPTSQDSDSAYQRLKLISALTKELQEVDQTLRGIYARATSLMSPEVKPSLALAGPKSKPEADIQDATVKALSGAKPKSARQVKKSSAPRQKRANSSNPGQKRVPNSQRLFDYLSKAIGALDGISLTHADLAEGSGLPTGLVGAALKALLNKGAILEVAASTYALPKAVAQVDPATVTEVNAG